MKETTNSRTDKKSKDSAKTSGLMKDVASIFEKDRKAGKSVPSLFKRTRTRFPHKWISRRRISSFLGPLFLPVFGTSGAITGLDIGRSTIRVAQMKKWVAVKNSVEVNEINIPQELTGSQHTEFIEENLSRIVNQPNFTKGTVVSSIDDSQVVTRVILVPATIAEENVETAVREKLQKQFDIKLAGSIVDYVRIGERTERGVKQLVLLATAAPKSTVNQRQSLLKNLGFRSVILEPAAFALARLFEGKKETIAVLNMGENVTSLSIVLNGTLQFSRYMHMTGSVLTKAIQDRLGSDYKKAERLKRIHGLLEEENKEVYHAIAFLITKFARDITLSLVYSARQLALPAQTKIDRMVLCGGGSRLKGLSSFLQKNMGISVELISDLPLGKVRVNGKEITPVTPELVSSFAPVVGLTLRRRDAAAKSVNFVPFRATIVKRLKELPVKLFAPTLASIVLFFSILTYNHHSLKLKVYREQLGKGKTELGVVRAKTSELVKRRDLLLQEIATQSEKGHAEEERLLALERIFNEETIWRDTFIELSSLLPENVWIRELSTDKNIFKIRATSSNSNLISRFMERLSKSVFFSSVQFCKSEKEELLGQKVISFEVNCRMKGNGNLGESN